MKVWKYDDSELKKVNINLEELIEIFDIKMKDMIEKMKHEITEDFRE